MSTGKAAKFVGRHTLKILTAKKNVRNHNLHYLRNKRFCAKRENIDSWNQKPRSLGSWVTPKFENPKGRFVGYTLHGTTILKH